MIKIRKATIKDVDELTNLWYNEELLNKSRYYRLSKNAKDLMKKELKKLLRKKDYVAFIAEENNEILGAIHGVINKTYFLFDFKKIGHVATLFVKKQHRKKGVFKLLFISLIKWFKSKGIKEIDIYVHLKNKLAKKIWTRYGFEEELIYMRKTLR